MPNALLPQPSRFTWLGTGPNMLACIPSGVVSNSMAGNKKFTPKNPAVVNWGCQLPQVDLHNYCKMVIFTGSIARSAMCRYISY